MNNLKLWILRIILVADFIVCYFLCMSSETIIEAFISLILVVIICLIVLLIFNIK